MSRHSKLRFGWREIVYGTAKPHASSVLYDKVLLRKGVHSWWLGRHIEATKAILKDIVGYLCCSLVWRDNNSNGVDILYDTLFPSPLISPRHHHPSSLINPSVNTHRLCSHPLIPHPADSYATFEGWGCGTPPSTAHHSRNIIKHILFTVAEIITLNSIIWLLRYFLAVRA